VKLFSYFRSSAAYRVRIALNLKGLSYDYLPVNLLQGEQPLSTLSRSSELNERIFLRSSRNSGKRQGSYFRRDELCQNPN
jgi:hypothetical protein